MKEFAEPILYFENPAGRIFAHGDGFIVFQYSAGKRSFTDFQELLTQTSNLLDRNNWNRLLADQRLMAPHTQEEAAWIVGNWLTEIGRRRRGGIYGAVLLAHDVFARLAMNEVMGHAPESTITYRVFETENLAVAWLTQGG
jgi:hypothetical protein